jgi:FdhD protein
MLNHHKHATSTLAQEHAIAIELNGISYAVMMMTPHDLEDFAIGFLFSENIIDKASDLKDIEICPYYHKPTRTQEIGSSLKITLSNRHFHRFKERIRLVRGNSGCGVCGAVALAQSFQQIGQVAPSTSTIEPNAFDIAGLHDIRERVRPFQTIAQNSGAMHGAFLLDERGLVKASSEDIGRHNALDKLIGKLLRSGINAQKHAVLVTSRCGAELVHKISRLPLSTLISFASPSQLALTLAKDAHITLVHLPKYDAPLVYSPTTTSEQTQ